MKNWEITALVLLMALALIFANLTRPVRAQGPPPPTSFADVSVVPGITIVIVRDTQGADQVIVSTFYWQDLPGVTQPILRSMTSVVGALKDVPVGADGAPDPKRVQAVHLTLVKGVSRMEWNPPKPTDVK